MTKVGKYIIYTPISKATVIAVSYVSALHSKTKTAELRLQHGVQYHCLFRNRNLINNFEDSHIEKLVAYIILPSSFTMRKRYLQPHKLIDTSKNFCIKGVQTCIDQHPIGTLCLQFAKCLHEFINRLSCLLTLNVQNSTLDQNSLN